MLLKSFVSLIVALLIQSLPVLAQESLKIAFSSCYEQDKYNLEIWQSIQSKQPDLFIFLGDNAYIDSDEIR